MQKKTMPKQMYQKPYKNIAKTMQEQKENHRKQIHTKTMQKHF